MKPNEAIKETDLAVVEALTRLSRVVDSLHEDGFYRSARDVSDLRYRIEMLFSDWVEDRIISFACKRCGTEYLGVREGGFHCPSCNKLNRA